MKLLVLSDTHRSLGFAYEAIETESPDAVAHLGDHLSDAEDTHQALLEERNGVTLLNPGAAGRFGRSSYAVVELANGKFSCQLKSEQ